MKLLKTLAKTGRSRINQLQNKEDEIKDEKTLIKEITE